MLFKDTVNYWRINPMAIKKACIHWITATLIAFLQMKLKIMCILYVCKGSGSQFNGLDLTLPIRLIRLG